MIEIDHHFVSAFLCSHIETLTAHATDIDIWTTTLCIQTNRKQAQQTRIVHENDETNQTDMFLFTTIHNSTPTPTIANKYNSVSIWNVAKESERKNRKREQTDKRLDSLLQQLTCREKNLFNTLVAYARTNDNWDKSVVSSEMTIVQVRPVSHPPLCFCLNNESKSIFINGDWYTNSLNNSIQLQMWLYLLSFGSTVLFLLLQIVWR